MPDRLDSWKEICAYLGRDRRTLGRWERERGMPVHRVPGGERPRVYAVPAELDRWLRQGTEAPPAAPTRPDAPESPVVAVLPFAILAGDRESEFFGDGLADDVIDAMTRVPDLRVIARTSSFAFRGKNVDVRQIGARLGASVLLEGSLRRSGSRIRVSAQLVTAADGCHLWSETFDRELLDVFAIQDEIASAVARALSARLGAKRRQRRSVPDLAAYELWLKGRSTALTYTAEAMRGASECFQAALDIDPAFALPHLGMAEMAWQAAEFGLLPAAAALERARSGVDRALALDDTLGEAHALDGVLRGLLDFDWDAASRSFDRALAENPSSSEVRRRHAWSYLAPRGRLPEADRAMDELVRLDPFSPFVLTSSGLLKFSRHDLAGAADAFRRAVDLLPSLWWARYFLGAMTLFSGDAPRGMALCEEALRSHPGPVADGARAAISGFSGDRERARQILARLLSENDAAPVSPVAIAWACIGAGDDRVFDWLGRCVDEREPIALHLSHMPIYDGLRGDPRLATLLARMGLGD